MFFYSDVQDIFYGWMHCNYAGFNWNGKVFYVSLFKMNVRNEVLNKYEAGLKFMVLNGSLDNYLSYEISRFVKYNLISGVIYLNLKHWKPLEWQAWSSESSIIGSNGPNRLEVWTVRTLNFKIISKLCQKFWKHVPD